jgi:hypothetical protein
VVGRQDEPERRDGVIVVREVVPETVERLRTVLEVGPGLVEAGEQPVRQALEM